MTDKRFNVVRVALSDANDRRPYDSMTNLSRRQADEAAHLMATFDMGVASPGCLAGDRECSCVKNATHRVEVEEA